MMAAICVTGVTKPLLSLSLSSILEHELGEAENKEIRTGFMQITLYFSLVKYFLRSVQKEDSAVSAVLLLWLPWSNCHHYLLVETDLLLHFL